MEDLCVVSNFPPSYWALSDILVIEDIRKRITSEDRNLRKEDNFTLRDHYLHLVYLYLLGIYIYFYNEKVYHGINEINQNARISSAYENKKYLVCKDFISEWKYFCLYHDVGYSDEVLKNKKIAPRVKTRKKDLSEFRKSIEEPSNVSLHHSIMATIEIICKVLIADLIIDYSFERKRLIVDHTTSSICQFISDGDTSLYGAKRKSIPQESVINTYARLQKIYSNRVLKYILTIFPADKLMVVVTNKRDGDIAILSLFDKKRKIYVGNRWLDNEEIELYCHNPELLFFDDLNSKDFELGFYIKDDVSITSELKLLYENADVDHWNKVLANLRLKEYELFLATVNEKQLTQLYFKLYDELFTFIIHDIFASPDILCSEIEQVNNIAYSSLLKKNISVIKNDYANQIVDKLFYAKKDPAKKNYQTIDTIFRAYGSRIKKNIRTLDSNTIDEITSNVEKAYKDKLSSDSDLIVVFLDLQQRLYEKFEEANKTFDQDTLLKDYTFQKFEALYGGELANKLIEEFSSTYEFKYGNISDHGVVSAVYVSRVLNMYQQLLCGKEKGDKIWLNILLDITNQDNLKKQYIENYKHIFSNVISAIYLHNLTISQYKDENMQKSKIKFSDSFTYFSMLCDALQQWNRPYSELQYQSRFLPDNASGVYNIEIKDGIIYVVEEDDADSQKRLNSNIETLSSYMNGIGAIVKPGHAK